MKKILNMIVSFMILGMKSIGNISTIIPMIEEEFVEKRKWIEKEDVLDAVAMGRCGPGAAVVNSMVFLGNKIYGFIGGVIAPVAFCIIPFIIITIISGFINEFLKNQIVNSIFKSLAVSIIIMLISTIIDMGKRTLKDKKTISIFFIVLTLSLTTNLSSIVYVVLIIIIGLFVKDETIN